MVNGSVSLRLRFVVALIGVLAFFQVYSVQAILPLLVTDLAATEVQAGLVVGATVLAVALMSPFMGMLSDVVGRKVLIVGSLWFLVLPTLLQAIAASVEAMMFYRFLQGLAIPGITVVLIAYIGEEFKGSALTQLMSLYVAGTVLGGFLGRFVLGHVSEWLGWQQALCVMAAVSFAGAWLVLKYLPASKQFVPKQYEGAAFGFQTALNTLSGCLKNRYVAAACLLGACVLCSLIGCFTYINLHLAKPPYMLSSSSLANLFVVYLLGMVVTPLSARLINRFGIRYTILSAVGLSMVGVVGTLLSPLAAVVVSLALMSCGVFVTQAATINYIAVHVTENRSLVSGLYYMAYYGGGTLGSWLCGLAYEQGSWTGLVLLLLSVQVFALLIAGKVMVYAGCKNTAVG